MGRITFADKEQATVNQQPEEKKWTFENANEVKEVVNENFHDGDDWDNTENKFPDSGGTAEDGSIRKWDRFVGRGEGNWTVVTAVGNQDVHDKSIFIALADNPGQDPENWRMI